MRIVVIGTGGVGGYFGARLAASGEEVTFVARGPHLSAIADNGLVLKSGLGDAHLTDVIVVDKLGPEHSADLYIIAVKLWSTETALKMIAPLIDESSAVLSLQNGVAANHLMTKHLPHDVGVGGLAYISSHIAQPGVIEHIGTKADIIVGELGGQHTDRIRRIHDVFSTANIKTSISTEIRSELWKKFIFLSALSGVCAYGRQTVGEILNAPEGRARLVALLTEAYEVGVAQGVELPADLTSS
ncbi:2-dehydropantoate 2-reductase, partial [bacterium]|nr:2-dehydropantoate 2-reductase [bacterium]